ncbi:DUF4342 domain-containing protein [Clostridium sp. MT-14]|jgi:hypothetical protein|uniref:DUF4342 domain-containing protein n=1 Tax=Clostridium sp. MT-14 TaxID=3348360 RepID=UPI00156CD55D|nr:Elongation factor Ts, mitochondrial [Clostridiaceae bacterium BL-3]
MSITIEQIDLLRKRADVGYKEAKEALERCNGDIVEALSYLEDENKIKPEKDVFKDSSFIKKIKSIISKGNKIRIVISRNEKTILNLPLTLAVVFTVIAFPAVIAAVVIALIANCRIRFHKDSGEECSINHKIEKVTSTVNNAKDKIVEDFKNA